MKIKRILANNRKKVILLETTGGKYEYPYRLLPFVPNLDDKIVDIYVDKEIDSRGFSFNTESGRNETVLLDQVLDYNKDPQYIRDNTLHNLTAEAIKAFDKQEMSKAEIARRMKTSTKQIYRLLDPSFYGKTIDQMVMFLFVLGKEIGIVEKKKKTNSY